MASIRSDLRTPSSSANRNAPKKKAGSPKRSVFSSASQTRSAASCRRAKQRVDRLLLADIGQSGLGGRLWLGRRRRLSHRACRATCPTHKQQDGAYSGHKPRQRAWVSRPHPGRLSHHRYLRNRGPIAAAGRSARPAHLTLSRWPDVSLPFAHASVMGN